MSPVSLAQHYHTRTKYAPETIASKGRALNWDEQPLPYKEYKLGTRFDLKPYLQPEEGQAAIDGLLQERWLRLSELLYLSYGLTARIPTAAGDVFLRSSPSAGGLYPAEVYVISAGTPILPAGLYNYQARDHSLLQFWADRGVWLALQEVCFHHPALQHAQLAIATTAVFFRSAWRYEDRAYRRIFLDTGHLLGNIELASALNDYRPCVLGGFNDEAADRLLFLDSVQEGVTAIAALVDLRDLPETWEPPQENLALPSATCYDYPAIPDGELLPRLHAATRIAAKPAAPPPIPKAEELRDDKYNFPFCTRISTVSQPIDWGEYLEELERTILRRRSTRAYSGADLTFDELKALLDFTYQPQHYIEAGLDDRPDYFALPYVQSFLVVSGVAGLEEGCYYYAPKAQELRQIRFKNFRRELHYLCLGQDLGRDAAAAIFHTADLQQAIARYGERAYRYLHADAGHLGQRLNLAAVRLGLGVSGIAGFFDDLVNDVLGIPTDEAVLYITTLGRPR